MKLPSEPAVFSPRAYLEAVGVDPDQGIEEQVIVVFNADVFALVAELLGVEGQSHAGRGRRPFFRLSEATRVADPPPGRFLLSGDGGPVAAMAVETAAARGARSILGLGYAGSLHTEVRPGDLVVAHAAIRDEGTSQHYLPAGCPATADFELGAALLAAARRRRKTHSGLIWSTDAPFRETAAAIEGWRRLGAVAVEMETAATLACARSLGLPAAVLQVISDDLSDLTWRPAYEAAHQGLTDAVQALVETVRERR